MKLVQGHKFSLVYLAFLEVLNRWAMGFLYGFLYFLLRRFRSFLLRGCPHSHSGVAISVPVLLLILVLSACAACDYTTLSTIWVSLTLVGCRLYRCVRRLHDLPNPHLQNQIRCALLWGRPIDLGNPRVASLVPALLRAATI